MLRISLKKISACLAGFLLLLTCSACKTGTSYYVEDYLNDLAVKTGIGDSYEIADNFEKLYRWGVVDRVDSGKLESKLDYDYLAKTICALIDMQGDSLQILKSHGYISNSVKGRDSVDRESANKVIDKAVHYINAPVYEKQAEYEYVKAPLDEKEVSGSGELVYRDDAYYISEINDEGEIDFRKAQYEEVFDSLDLQLEEYLDFTQAIVIPYGEEYDDTSYINENYELLASNGSHVFHTDGFRVSYSLNTSGIDIHVSRNENGLNVYLDASIHNVKPTIIWHEKKNDLKNCLFTLNFNTTEKLGVSTGKYRNYHLDFKDLDPSSFMSLLHSIIEPQSEAQEATIRICEVKVPLSEIPTAYLDLDILLKLYASGKCEFVLNTANKFGFETRNGQIRYINDASHDINTILQASSKAAIGLNAGLEVALTKLSDIQLDAGVKGLVRSTLHLYDEDGSQRAVSSAVPYSGLCELSDGNSDVLVCGDLSLYWLMDLIINTPASRMNRLGFSRTYSIMDEEDQIFNNLHHIENGHFVEHCTRDDRVVLQEMSTVKANRIVLDSYAEVLLKNETYQIIVKALPEGYEASELLYESSDASIASVEDGLVKALKEGSARIQVTSSDGKYSSYVTILVSTG